MDDLVLLMAVFLVILAGLGWKLLSNKQSAKRVISPGRKTAKLQHLDTPKALSGFDWAVTEPLKFRNFKPVYFITMGVRLADPADLIIIDRNYLSRIRIRHETLERHPDKVSGCLPAGVAAVQELYNYLLSQYLPGRYPSMFEKSGKKFYNRVTQSTVPLKAPKNALEALKLLGQTIEDDLFIMQQEMEGHRCVAALCTSPSGFDPSEKLGLLLREIHSPVPAYDKIGTSMERYFSRVEVGQNAVRTNWSITTTPDLLNLATNHVKDGDIVEEDIDVDISQARLRVELQTLSRLPKTQALLFSFKTYTYPLVDIKAEGLGPQLADAIDGFKLGNAKGMWTYKGGVKWGKSVCQYLREQ